MTLMAATNHPAGHAQDRHFVPDPEGNPRYAWSFTSMPPTEPTWPGHRRITARFARFNSPATWQDIPASGPEQGGRVLSDAVHTADTIASPMNAQRVKDPGPCECLPVASIARIVQVREGDPRRPLLGRCQSFPTARLGSHDPRAAGPRTPAPKRTLSPRSHSPGSQMPTLLDTLAVRRGTSILFAASQTENRRQLRKKDICPPFGDRPKSLIPDLALLDRASPRDVELFHRRPPRAGPFPMTFGVSGRAALAVTAGDFPRLCWSSRWPLRPGFRLGLDQHNCHLALEQVPEPIARPSQAQVLIRATAAPLPPAEHPRVPVQPLQIQQPLIQRPMPRLVHPQHAVHPLHRAARATARLNTDATARYASRQSGSILWQRTSCTSTAARR